MGGDDPAVEVLVFKILEAALMTVNITTKADDVAWNFETA